MTKIPGRVGSIAQWLSHHRSASKTPFLFSEKAVESRVESKSLESSWTQRWCIRWVAQNVFAQRGWVANEGQSRSRNLFKTSQKWTHALYKRGHIHRGGDHVQAQFDVKNLSRVGRVGKFRAHYPSFVSLTCYRTLIEDNLWVVSGVFRFPKISGV